MKHSLVSVVIPTRHRPELLLKAIQSVLAQTIKNIELIVVIDGPDKETKDILDDMSDERITVVPLVKNVGGSEARNIGIQHASAEWIALLDDDDEWLQDKLKEQLDVATLSKRVYPVVACKAYVHHQEGCSREIWPRRLPRHQENASDYLLLRSTIFGGETTFLSSMILAKKEFLLKFPFQNIKKHQDWDWLINVSNHPHFELIFVDKPLLIYNNTIRSRLSTGVNATDWQSSLAWIESNRYKVSDAAYSSFLCTEVARRARNGNDIVGLTKIFRKAVSSNAITIYQIISFFAICLLGAGVRTSFRKIILSMK